MLIKYYLIEKINELKESMNYNLTEKKKLYKSIYEITICFLAIISVVLVIIDINNGLSDWMIASDRVIYVIFISDYIFRLIYSHDKKKFIKSNLFDLIAILPLNSALRVFRTFKFFRILRFSKLTKLTRLVSFSGRMLSKCKSFLNTNGFKYILIFSCVLIMVGGVLISVFEDMTIIDGIWWAFVTTTTVGYGDISPATAYGRIVACLLMICGIGLIGSLTSTITSFFMNSSKPSESISNDRIDMVLKLYGELTESEREVFKNKIDS